jgi:hypothetical protein
VIERHTNVVGGMAKPKQKKVVTYGALDGLGLDALAGDLVFFIHDRHAYKGIALACVYVCDGVYVCVCQRPVKGSSHKQYEVKQ